MQMTSRTQRASRMIQINLLILAIAPFVQSSQLDEVVRDAFAKMKVPARGKRATPESKLIAAENTAFEAAVSTAIDQLGLERDTAVRRVREAIRTRRRVSTTLELRDPELALLQERELLLSNEFHLAGVSQQNLNQLGGYPDEIPDVVCDPDVPTCSSSHPYYSFDGTCNNLDNPFWGAANQPFRRIFPAEYAADNAPRGGFHPSSLPNPRHVSTELHPSNNDLDYGITYLVAAFGQFVDHDITLTPEADEEACCFLFGKGGNMPDNCFPIPIPTDDTFYSSQWPPQTCLDFSRSFPFCFAEPREQFNAITAFIDGSNIYGSNEESASALRSFVGGKLKTNPDDLLPEILGGIRAGDIRALEQPGLTSMHALWMREHNRLAVRTKNINPSLNDQQIYLKTRQLVAAQLQNIIYLEWLPVIIGHSLISTYDLEVDSQQPQYDDNMDPSVFNSFAAAAFRFGHSLIQGTVSLVSATTGNSAGSFQLRDNFFNPTLYQQGGGATMENILKGQSSQVCQKVDRFVVEDLTNFLFPEPGHNFGSDLVARNIQRGRDHGLPGYNKFRQFCGLASIPNMATTPAEFSSANWARIASVYTNPNDIDLFSAGLLEDKLSDGVVGPTFGCLIAEQFRRLKFGDRFFFSHSGQAGSLSSTDFAYVRSRTMRDVLCDNTDIKDLKDNVFLQDGSPLRSCAQVGYEVSTMATLATYGTPVKDEPIMTSPIKEKPVLGISDPAKFESLLQDNRINLP